MSKEIVDITNREFADIAHHLLDEYSPGHRILKLTRAQQSQLYDEVRRMDSMLNEEGINKAHGSWELKVTE